MRNDAESFRTGIIKLFQLPAYSQVCFQEYLTSALSQLLMLFLTKFSFFFYFQTQQNKKQASATKAFIIYSSGTDM